MMAEEMQQDRDYKWFLENYDSLFRKFGKAYLAIKNGAVLGSYQTYADAVHETERKEALGSFIVQYCNGEESGYTNHISSLFVVGR